MMQKPSSIEILKNPCQLTDVNFNTSSLADHQSYQQQLHHLQTQLLKIQQAYFHLKQRAIIVFEGWDASGKGGIIRKLTQKIDPRGFHVYPFSTPTAEQQSRHYLYRFQQCLPTAGSVAIFDRSYYGRVLVERVEQFASLNEWQRAYQEINEFERLLSDDEVKIIKLFIHITPDEQLKRFNERLNNPYKRWKLTEEDIRNRAKWADYEAAIHDMFNLTSTKQNPWHIIAGNKKWYARTQALTLIVTALSEGIDIEPPPLDPTIIKLAQATLGLSYTNEYE